MPAEGVWFWFEGLIDIFFYVDLVLNFFLAYEVAAWRCCPVLWVPLHPTQHASQSRLGGGGHASHHEQPIVGSQAH
jgi:hypothetical protein